MQMISLLLVVMSATSTLGGIPKLFIQMKDEHGNVDVLEVWPDKELNQRNSWKYQFRIGLSFSDGSYYTIYVKGPDDSPASIDSPKDPPKELRVRGSNTVEQLRDGVKISFNAGLPVVLSVNGKQLDDDSKTLQQLQIVEGTTVTYQQCRFGVTFQINHDGKKSFITF